MDLCRSKLLAGVANLKKMFCIQLCEFVAKGKLVRVKASSKLAAAAKKATPKPKAKSVAPKAANKDAVKPKKTVVPAKTKIAAAAGLVVACCISLIVLSRGRWSCCFTRTSAMAGGAGAVHLVLGGGSRRTDSPEVELAYAMAVHRLGPAGRSCAAPMLGWSQGGSRADGAHICGLPAPAPTIVFTPSTMQECRRRDCDDDGLCEKKTMADIQMKVCDICFFARHRRRRVCEVRRKPNLSSSLRVEDFSVNRKLAWWANAGPHLQHVPHVVLAGHSFNALGPIGATCYRCMWLPCP